MMGAMREGRVQLVGLGLLVVAMGAALLVATRVSPRFAFLVQDDALPWIASPDPVSTGVVSAPFASLHVVEFARTLTLESGAGPLRLRVQALRGFELELDGRPLAARAWDEGHWRRPTVVEVDDFEPGEHRLVVRVRNPNGPPLLRLSGEGAGARFGSDAGFEARRDGGPPQQARPANDTVRAAAALPTPRVIRSLQTVSQSLPAAASPAPQTASQSGPAAASAASQTASQSGPAAASVA